jgi:hypothetical protein
VVCSKTNEAAELENFFPAVGFALNIFFFVFYCSAVSFFPAAAGWTLSWQACTEKRDFAPQGFALVEQSSASRQ